MRINWRVENVFTVAITAATIVCLYSMSNSWHSLWALLLLANLNGHGVD